MSKSYFRRAEGAVLLYDCTCESSFTSVKEWINIINETTDKKIPIVIVANKIDLRDEARKLPGASRVIEREEGAKLAAEFDCLFVEASAKSGTNMEESLIELCRFGFFFSITIISSSILYSFLNIVVIFIYLFFCLVK